MAWATSGDTSQCSACGDAFSATVREGQAAARRRRLAGTWPAVGPETPTVNEC